MRGHGRTELWPRAIILATMVAAIVVFSPVASVRPYVVLGFALICPGLAFVRLLQLGEPLLELAVAIGLSIGVELLASLAMLYAGVWSPTALFAGLVGVALVCAGLELVGVRFRTEPST